MKKRTRRDDARRIDAALEALRRHLHAAAADPEIAAVPALAERIKRFTPLLVPERPEADELGRAVQSIIIARAYLCELANDPRLTEADRARAQELEIIFAGVRFDDEASERTMRDLPWTSKGSARRAADSRWRNKPTRAAEVSALDAVAKGSTKNAAARDVAERFGVNYETIRKRLQGK
jgi:hypothetical protein